MINEDFLHYIWKTQQIKTSQFKLENHDDLQILQPGQLNSNAGPDFSSGEIRIGKTRWVGSIEIHVLASDWLRHAHHLDPAYEQVILHVVWMNDTPIYRSDGSEIPCIQLKGLIPKYLLSNYKSLNQNFSKIPCESSFHRVDSFRVEHLLERLLIERIEKKNEALVQLLKKNKEDWEASFYSLLFKYFGFKVNAPVFELLAERIPLLLIRKYKGNQVKLEALFFGQAGFLESEPEDDHQHNLRQEYIFLKQKYKLEAMDKSSWKYLRMRPGNFPTVRMAQLLALLEHGGKLYRDSLESWDLDFLRKLFQFEVSPYWREHYDFSKKWKRKYSGRMGAVSIDSILINVIFPFRFHYMKNWSFELPVEKLLDLFRKIDPENNKEIRMWTSLGYNAKSAFDSQALLQLKSAYCDPKKCLLCSVGNLILKSNHHD